MDLAGKQIGMVVAFEGYRDEEYNVPKALFERRGARVVTIANRKGTATGKLGAATIVDRLLTEALADDFDAVVFVGGPGSKGYFDSGECHQLARAALAKGKVVAAICSAGGILAKAGVLRGKKATCYPTEGELLRASGATYTATSVETDGLLVTADGPQSAAPFGAAVADLLARTPARPTA